jgi:hypothetical protein
MKEIVESFVASLVSLSITHNTLSARSTSERFREQQNIAGKEKKKDESLN